MTTRKRSSHGKLNRRIEYSLFTALEVIDHQVGAIFACWKLANRERYIKIKVATTISSDILNDGEFSLLGDRSIFPANHQTALQSRPIVELAR
jgi:hypothetical protein